MFIDLKVRKNKLAWEHEGIRSGKEFLANRRDLSDATNLLTCLNEANPSIQFTMEVATNDRLAFMEIIKINLSPETRVYK